ncbi:MAG: GFA family protein [Pseudomonadota bacterium]
MSNKASCLCGDVRWEFSGDPVHAFNCHCKMCRKAHGTAFGTYWFLNDEQFQWTSSTETVVHYRSSHLLVRSFCGVCGSVVPYGTAPDEQLVVPGGCHTEGKKSDCHIFVNFSAPWFDIVGELPRHTDYPDFTGLDRVEETVSEPPPDGVVRGSCLCGGVEYHVHEAFKVAHNCHCSRCRKGRAAAHATNGFTSANGVEFVSGKDNLKIYKVEDAEHFTQVFCKTCGSKMPRIDNNRGIAVIPFGGLDDDPNTKAVDHIFVDYKANWYDIEDGLPQFPEAPD